jgi:hypothetical protein
VSVLAYRDGAAMWRALRDRAKAAAKETGIPAQHLVRRFVYDRFLARVFDDPTEPWVLKGGTAVLARVNDARHSKDVDLLRRLGDIDEALAALRAVCDVDLQDHFRFVIGAVRSVGGTTQQPDVAGFRVHIDAYCGVTTRRDGFGVDLVTGSLMTGPPETHLAGTPLDLPGLERPTLHLYPVVDHIADKLCATEAVYVDRGASTRVRDLVDLVVFARTHRVEGAALCDAIRAERMHRGLPHVTELVVPEAWGTTYPPVAKEIPHCADFRDAAAATALVARFLEPAMTRTARDQVWDPALTQWIGRAAESENA